MDSGIIIIGAGMAGLNAARELLRAGKKVTIVEGRDRIGGRIHTLEQQFSVPVDSGAEFVHGDLPLTKKLASHAGAPLSKKKGQLYKYENGMVTPIDSMIEDYKELIGALKDLKTDMPLSEFLRTSPIGSNEKAKRSAIRLAEGFDVADIDKISAFAVRDEWKEESTIAEPYVLKEGYGSLAHKLYQECLDAGCQVLLSTPVSGIRWKKHRVAVLCGQHQQFEAEQVIITVPLGILNSQPAERHHIHFMPELPEKINAAKQIGYGPVVKAIFEFKEVFWDLDDYKGLAQQTPNLAFMISDGHFPTWWTHPSAPSIITGWAGGPKAEQLKHSPDQEIEELALSELAKIFSVTPAWLRGRLHWYHIANWGNDPFSYGAYSYEMTGSEEARKIMQQPVEDTVFFCGEALDDSGISGTVEAALSSGIKTAKKILNKEE